MFAKIKGPARTEARPLAKMLPATAKTSAATRKISTMTEKTFTLIGATGVRTGTIYTVLVTANKFGSLRYVDKRDANFYPLFFQLNPPLFNNPPASVCLI